ncbi:metallophosphoesterase [Pirellulales bacterium]|nr:metallophosphoesterase [Pirellulales bacterium]
MLNQKNKTKSKAPLDNGKISRRRFLGRSSLTAAIPYLSSCSSPGYASEKGSTAENSFALLSDMHVSADRDRINYYYPPIKDDEGINLNSCFTKVVAELVALKSKPHLAIICGDCAYDTGTKEEYVRFSEIAAPLHQAEIPLYSAMGNHDAFAMFNEIVPDHLRMTSGAEGHCCYVVHCKNVNWFVLDSTSGAHGSAQHEWLSEELDKHPDKPAMLVTHYPLSFEHEEIDHPFIDSTLGDTDELFEIIASRKQVKALFVGHWHCWYLAEVHGIPIISMPSVASSFRPVDPSGWLNVETKEGGMILTLHHSNPRNGLHKDHRRNITLDWR